METVGQEVKLDLSQPVDFMIAKKEYCRIGCGPELECEECKWHQYAPKVYNYPEVYKVTRLEFR